MAAECSRHGRCTRRGQQRAFLGTLCRMLKQPAATSCDEKGPEAIAIVGRGRDVKRRSERPGEANLGRGLRRRRTVGASKAAKAAKASATSEAAAAAAAHRSGFCLGGRCRCRGTGVTR